MPGPKRRREYGAGPAPANMSTGVTVSGYDQADSLAGGMLVKDPGFIGMIQERGPPPYHTWQGEEQEMAILAMLVRVFVFVCVGRKPSW